MSESSILGYEKPRRQSVLEQVDNLDCRRILDAEDIASRFIGLDKVGRLKREELKIIPEIDAVFLTSLYLMSDYDPVLRDRLVSLKKTLKLEGEVPEGLSATSSSQREPLVEEYYSVIQSVQHRDIQDSQKDLHTLCKSQKEYSNEK